MTCVHKPKSLSVLKCTYMYNKSLTLFPKESAYHTELWFLRQLGGGPDAFWLRKQMLECMETSAGGWELNPRALGLLYRPPRDTVTSYPARLLGEGEKKSLGMRLRNSGTHCLLVSSEYELSFCCTGRLVGKVVETAFPEDQVTTLPCRGMDRHNNRCLSIEWTGPLNLTFPIISLLW